jgi:hypothetical protein
MACACVYGTNASVGIGDILPTFVYPSDVDREKARLDPSFRATEETARACAQMTGAMRAGWDTFYAEWRGFADRATPLFGSANEWDLTQKFARDLAGWQESIRGVRCGVPGPNPLPVETTADTSWIKWAAAATIVVAGVYAARMVLR